MNTKRNITRLAVGVLLAVLGGLASGAPAAASGDTLVTQSGTALPALPMTAYAAIAAGGYHTCALTTGGASSAGATMDTVAWAMERLPAATPRWM